MNPLVKDPKTGFLESSSYSPAAFNAAKKAKMIELALNFIETNKKIPTMRSLSKAMGCDLTTIERHLREDETFRNAFREVTLSIDDLISERRNEYALNPNGFMDAMAWRRRHLPEYWHPDRVIHVEHSVSIAGELQDKIGNYIDVDALPS